MLLGCYYSVCCLFAISLSPEELKNYFIRFYWIYLTAWICYSVMGYNLLVFLSIRVPKLLYEDGLINFLFRFCFFSASF